MWGGGLGRRSLRAPQNALSAGFPRASFSGSRPLPPPRRPRLSQADPGVKAVFSVGRFSPAAGLLLTGCGGEGGSQAQTLRRKIPDASTDGVRAAPSPAPDHKHGSTRFPVSNVTRSDRVPRRWQVPPALPLEVAPRRRESSDPHLDGADPGAKGKETLSLQRENVVRLMGLPCQWDEI